MRHPQRVKRRPAHTRWVHIQDIYMERGIRAGIPGDTRMERDIPAVDRADIRRVLRAAA